MGRKNRRNTRYYNPSYSGVAHKCAQPVIAPTQNEMPVPNPAFAIPDPVFTNGRSNAGTRRAHPGDVSITVNKNNGSYRGRIAFWNNGKKILDKFKRISIDINSEAGFVFFQGGNDRGTTLSRNGNDSTSIYTQITVTAEEKEFLAQLAGKDFFIREHPRYKGIYYIEK